MCFLSMPHSGITRPSLDIKTSFSSSVIENDVKVNIMPFRILSSIGILNFKAPVAETLIWASLKIVFLKCIINRLSVHSLTVHHQTSPWRLNAGFSSCLIEKT